MQQPDKIVDIYMTKISFRCAHSVCAYMTYHFNLRIFIQGQEQACEAQDAKALLCEPFTTLDASRCFYTLGRRERSANPYRDAPSQGLWCGAKYRREKPPLCIQTHHAIISLNFAIIVVCSSSRVRSLYSIRLDSLNFDVG